LIIDLLNDTNHILRQTRRQGEITESTFVIVYNSKDTGAAH